MAGLTACMCGIFTFSLPSGFRSHFNRIFKVVIPGGAAGGRTGSWCPGACVPQLPGAAVAQAAGQSAAVP